MAAYGDFQAGRIILYHALAASLLGRFPSNLAYGFLTMLPTRLFFFSLLRYFSAEFWLSGGLAFVPVRHLAQWPPVLEYHLGPPLAPLVSFGAPPLLRYMYI